VTKPEPIRICVFCFSLVDPEEETILVRLVDSTDGEMLARGVGHADCGQKRWDLIRDYTEVLERNRQNMPSSDSGNTGTVQTSSEATEELEDPEIRSETENSEVIRYFGPYKNPYGASDGSNGC